MHDAASEDDRNGSRSAPLSEAATDAEAQTHVQTYLEHAGEFENPFEATLHVLNGKLIQHALWLQDDLESVRASLPDPEERLAADLETTEAVYKISKAVNDQSQLLMRVQRLREKQAPQRSMAVRRSRPASRTPAKKSRRPK
jgi:hypothetical protein